MKVAGKEEDEDSFEDYVDPISEPEIPEQQVENET
jgi:hypothetical protein